MPHALFKLIVAAILSAMLLAACATPSSTPPPEEIAAPEPAVKAAPAESASTEDMQARRQYEIERNRFTYEDIFFNKNQYALDAQARELLNWKAEWLRNHPTVEVIIEGHCAEGGRAENNMALGLRRAGEVKGYLLRKGVARSRLTAISYGSERPIAQGTSEEIQAKNRRVRLMIVED